MRVTEPRFIERVRLVWLPGLRFSFARDHGDPCLIVEFAGRAWHMTARRLAR